MNQNPENLAAKFRINKDALALLRNGRNLLAFSHGVDSTALFYILQNLGVKFDLAIMDYGARAQSRDEVAAARELASEFSKRIFVREARISGANFESRARAARYAFFDEICASEGYGNLILAHQLDDRFEWFLMQFSKGAGLNELIGMGEISSRGDVNLVRPLLNVSKRELKFWLDERGIKYFVDGSNFDDKFSRNAFRRDFSEPFLARFKSGAARSFEILERDARVLEPKILKASEQAYLVKADANFIRGADRACKILGVLLSAAQRRECERCLQKGVDFALAGKIAIGASSPLPRRENFTARTEQTERKPQDAYEKFILITPYVSKIKMDKNFKEACRTAKISPINRGFLFSRGISPSEILASFAD